MTKIMLDGEEVITFSMRSGKEPGTIDVYLETEMKVKEFTVRVIKGWG